MTAHLHGQLFNASAIAASLGGISHTTVARYLDSLVDTMMLRRLEPHFVNVDKRLVKSPKVYVRDSGLLHALLNIPDINSLIGHPVAGHSFEGLVMEQIMGLVPKGADVSFYRTAAGAVQPQRHLFPRCATALQSSDPLSPRQCAASDQK